ncbi:hypothetical protein GFS31_03940 [Leptolyngbya sp. BL0902]|uniref:hypothetical protein n=1 Tax=Leptolyngbya sp. BL0902 TaxID=1115757 RepID=UPI0018E864E7|nr:hypothetical protein [Leptolyngbya sp. BL0902]QQE63725.1 hypothetical protein GFS31_03940 [Leptolyngbya sp. BL0902]
MQTLLSRSLMWLFAEIVLTVLNLDDLADYGEFIFRVQDDLALQRERIELISPSRQVYLSMECCTSWA